LTGRPTLVHWAAEYTGARSALVRSQSCHFRRNSINPYLASYSRSPLWRCRASSIYRGFYVIRASRAQARAFAAVIAEKVLPRQSHQYQAIPAVLSAGSQSPRADRTGTTGCVLIAHPAASHRVAAVGGATRCPGPDARRVSWPPSCRKRPRLRKVRPPAHRGGLLRCGHRSPYPALTQV